jgi:Zn-dependent protease with chaperone function
MAMDFFEHQEQARKQTTKLVVLFILAVIAILALAIAGFYTAEPGEPAPAFSWWQPIVLIYTAIGVLLLVGAGTLYKISQLRQGGGHVAEMMGGRQIEPDSEDPDEQKVLNVVEEMAIASGTAVPPVYLLAREKGINAFAAGFTPDDAVIAVTRGTIQHLSRDELQGVIAHEFSHILNSDMRTNIRLMGVIHGIVVLSIIGLMLVRVMFYGSLFGAHHDTSVGRDDDRGGGDGRVMIALAALGVALLVIGAVGSFFGKLIKAAVSRQREYLADASAVQFTRNPEGLSGALQKIGGLTTGSKVRDAHAEEASHMFFGQAFTSKLSSLFATHPPLTERIQRIDPSFQGEFAQVDAEPDRGEATAGFAGGGPARSTGREPGGGFSERLQKATQSEGESASDAASAPAGAASQGDVTQTAAAVGAAAAAGGDATSSKASGSSAGSGDADATGIGRIGNPTPEHLQHASKLIRELPQPVKKAAHEPYGARALIYALLLDPNDTVRDHQWQHLNASADPQVQKLTRQLAEQIDHIDPQARLPLLDMAVPALRELSPTQYQTFKQNLDALIKADEKIELFEWMLQRTLNRYVAPDRPNSDQGRVRHKTLSAVADPCALLLSTLAYVGHSDQDAAKHAFEQAKQATGLQALSLRDPKDCNHAALDEALSTLAGLAPRAKRSLLMACGISIAADAEATVREVELLRLFADSLGCPMPPVLPGQPLQ